MVTFMHNCRFLPQNSTSQRPRLCKLLLVFGCFRSCCWTELCAHSWEEQEVPQSWTELENVQRWEGRLGLGFGFFFFLVKFSAKRKGPERSHHQKHLLFPSVCHQASTPSLTHVHFTPFQAFLIVFCILNLPFAGFLPAQKVDGQSQGWLRHLCCVCSPKIQCKLFSVSSPHPQPILEADSGISTVEMLPRC